MKWNAFPRKRSAASLTVEDFKQCGHLILDGMDCSPAQPRELHHLPMAWNLKPSQWGQPLTFQARPLRSRAGGRPW